MERPFLSDLAARPQDRFSANELGGLADLCGKKQLRLQFRGLRGSRQQSRVPLEDPVQAVR